MIRGGATGRDAGKQGFTLLELSIVLVVIAIVTGMAAQTGFSVVATSRLTATRNKMKTIEDALMAFRTANDRLPCPGDLTVNAGSANYGLEAGAGSGSTIGTGTGACTGTGMLPAANFSGFGATNIGATGAEGALPAVTLGLSPDFMVDGWGHRFRYVVDINMTAANAFPSNNLSYSCGPITIDDANGNARSTGAIYALISHGGNGHGAYTSNGVVLDAGSANANEQTNCHCNSSAVATTYAPTYVQMQPSIDPSNSLDNFDDLVIFKERWQMMTPWDSAASTSTKQTGVPAGIASPDLVPSGPSCLGGILFSNSGGSFSFLPLSNMSPAPLLPAVDCPNGSMYSYWSPDNRYLLVSAGWESQGQYFLYSVNGQNITQIASNLPGLPTPPYGPAGAAWSPDNQYLAVTPGVSPYIYIYKRCGSTLTPVSGLAAHEGSSANVTWTPDSQWVIPDYYWWMGIYQRTSAGAFNLVPYTNLFPGGIQNNGPMEFSSTGTYAIEQGPTSGNSTTFYVYMKSGSGTNYVYNFLTTFSVPFSSILAYAWSPNTNYFAVVSSWGNTPPYLYVVTRNSNTFLPTPGLLTTPANQVGLFTVGWTPDSQFLVAAGYDYTADENGIVLFQVNSSGVFTEISPITPPPGYTGYGHGFWVFMSN